MEVQKINGNCSMLSVSDNPSSEITNRQFLKLLSDAIARYNNKIRNSLEYIGSPIELSNIKCVMLTTNRKFYLWPFFSRGFSYCGNSRYKARVRFIAFPKGLRNKLSKEGII